MKMSVMGQLLLAATMAVGACSSTTPDGVSLKILTADPKAGLSGSVMRGDQTLFFETVRTLRAERNDGESPYLISARFVDENGDNIVVVDTEHLTEGAWKAARQQARDPNQMIAMLVDAGAALEAAHVDAAMAPEVETLLNMISSTANPPADLVRPTAGGTLVGYNWYTKQIWLFKKNLKFLGVKYGEHSSTRTYYWINGVLQPGYLDLCNHGDCPGSSSMSFAFYCQTPDNLSTVPASPILCQTGYAWSSTGGGHNCNDDSQMQLQGIKYNVQYTGWEGSCNSSSSTHANAPGGCP